MVPEKGSRLIVQITHLWEYRFPTKDGLNLGINLYYIIENDFMLASQIDEKHWL